MMSGFERWTRRRFISTSGALAAGTAVGLRPLSWADAAAFIGGQNGIPPPVVITGGIRPLLESNVARPMRYTPEGRDFVIRNGTEFFNRPLYGPISDFRVDAGDRPEFSFYMPGHGGNLKLGILAPGGSKWLSDADEVIARYRPGMMIYEVRDKLLGSASLRLDLLTRGLGSGLLLRAQALDSPEAVRLAWAFGGVSGRKGRRNGDIGCEVGPVSTFFQVRPEECAGNIFSLDPANDGERSTARLHSSFCDLELTFPRASTLGIADFHAWQAAPAAAEAGESQAPRPVLTGSVALSSDSLYVTVARLHEGQTSLAADPATEFKARSEQVAAVARTIQVDTPDPHINAASAALGVVADALWDPQQECVMHGCVAWRVALAGWRGPYVLDASGRHHRARLQFRHWLKHQNLSRITTGDPATGPADPGTHLARKEHLLHSNGDLSDNHYDMNLVFFDVLLRHLRWTGDIEFAREIWPAFKRHLAWEKRLFRRTFRSPSGKELPLYEAYAAIWASDNLQYSGGGAAHSSAYNIYAHRAAARLAHLLGEDPAPFEVEAALIQEGMQELLWVPDSGAFAESKDLMGPQTVYANPAVWTVYHTIDSEVPTQMQAWQMVAERLAALKRIPVRGPGVPDGGWFLLSCSNWLPYMWSLNLIALAENMHFALSMWQAGMADEAFRLFKGNLLDSMFMGLCPGDFHMTSALDAHRQEAQRDFGDPTGITSRALVEGLFGVQPDLLNRVVRIRPGIPSDWDHASLEHADFDFHWRRDGNTETYEFASRFAQPVALEFRLPARTTTVPQLKSNGRAITSTYDPAAIGTPCLKVNLPPAPNHRIELNWQGRKPPAAVAHQRYRVGEPLKLPRILENARIEDPQQCLAGGRTKSPGFHTVFAVMREGDCEWAMPVSFQVQPQSPQFVPVPHVLHGAQVDPVDLSPVLSHSITEIFTRKYMAPRADLCTLSVPDTLLGGWANIEPGFAVDDSGLRRAEGMLHTPLGVSFRTPAGKEPNCVFLSWFEPDRHIVSVPLSGRAAGVYLLVAGSTLPQCSRMEHARVTATYTDGKTATLSLRNPETWWPIEQDYLLDDYLFVNDAPLPPRVDLRTGETRLLNAAEFKGKGRTVPGGAATILHLALDPAKTLTSLSLEVKLYGIVVALLGITLTRPVI